MSLHDFHALPPDLPVPVDDGAADHLPGLRLPALALRSTHGREADLAAAAAAAGTLVLYVYPRTGIPGQPSPDGWDAIPGARGCTPQSCAFRDHFAEIKRLGVAQLYGLSTQTTDYQREAVERLHLPFAILSDEKLALTKALRLPTFTVAGMTLLTPVSARIFVAGLLAVTALPPFGPFFSELKIIRAGLEVGRGWTVTAFLAGLLIAFFGLTRLVFAIVDGRPRAAARATGEKFRETASVIVPPLVLLGASLWLGLATPEVLRDAWTASVKLLSPAP